MKTILTTPTSMVRTQFGKGCPMTMENFKGMSDPALYR